MTGWSPERKPVAEVARQVIAELDKTGEIEVLLQSFHVWSIMGDNYRCAGEGLHELLDFLQPEYRARVEKIRKEQEEEGRRIQEMIMEDKRKEVREKAKGVHHTRCLCGGEVYFMGSLCCGPPTGNGYSEADEYTCGTCLREFSGHVATYRD